MENARSSVGILGISQGLQEEKIQHPAWVPEDMNLQTLYQRAQKHGKRSCYIFRESHGC